MVECLALDGKIAGWDDAAAGFGGAGGVAGEFAPIGYPSEEFVRVAVEYRAAYGDGMRVAMVVEDTLEPMGRGDGVGVDEGEDFTAACFDAHIAGGAGEFAFGGMDDLDFGEELGGGLISGIGGGVGQDDLAGCGFDALLTAEGFEGLEYEGGRVVGGNNYGDVDFVSYTRLLKTRDI